MSQNSTVYDFSFNSIDGKPVSLKNFTNKVILIVNTASKCGFTKQYKDLEEIYKKHRDKGFEIIAVPCDDFGGQELKSNEEIAQFCSLNYNPSFILTEKYTIKGENAHPFYVWARQKLGFGTAPKWNFHKYLINRQGYLVNYFHSFTTPKNKRLLTALEQLLNSGN